MAMFNIEYVLHYSEDYTFILERPIQNIKSHIIIWQYKCKPKQASYLNNK